MKQTGDGSGTDSLLKGDWNAEWIRLGPLRDEMNGAAYWDKRADGLAAAVDTSPYASTFIEYAGVRPGESVLDVGAGWGTLALPLARAGHPICALDFSPRMVALLRQRATEEGLQSLAARQLSWEDDWEAAGISPADVAVASRSLAVADLAAALRKLDAFARRRACLTLSANGLYFPDLLAQEAVGREVEPRYEHVYAVNILHQMGIAAEVRFIPHDRRRTFQSREQARESLRKMIAPADEREERLFDEYVDTRVVQRNGADGAPLWTHDTSFTVKWAFLAWDKEP